ncbi:MAG: hypothetical protein Q6363_005070 [Candidatus Njordarchaeota archaeon]
MVIVASIAGVKTKTKPETIGEATEKTDSTLVIMQDNGEIIKEIKTGIAATVGWPTISKNQTWIGNTGDPIRHYADIGIINTRTLEIIVDHGLPYHLALEEPKLPYKATRFKPGYEKLKKFGGLYEYPREKTIQIWNNLTRTGNPNTGRISWTNDEKYMCIDAKNEIRIYDMKTMELVDIVTYNEIMHALLLARAPRELMKWAPKAIYAGIINAENPEIIWIHMYTYDKHTALFAIHVPTRTIISPIKHSLEIVSDLLPSTRYIPMENLLSRHIEALTTIMYPTPTKNITVEIGLTLYKIDSPNDPKEKLRLGIPPETYHDNIIVQLDTELNIVNAAHTVTIDNIEYGVYSYPQPQPDYLVLKSMSGFKPLSLDQEPFFGIVRLDWKTLRIHSYLSDEKIEKMANEIVITHNKDFVTNFVAQDIYPRVHGDEVFIAISAWPAGQKKRELPEKIVLLKTDWRTTKMTILNEWEGHSPASTNSVLFQWGAWTS